MRKKVTFANGDVYEGETESFGERVDLPHGMGKITYANGNVYEGETRHGKPHGESKGMASKSRPTGAPGGNQITRFNVENGTIVITEHRLIPSKEITCTQCGTIIKLVEPSMEEDYLCVCPKCGANYKYICKEPIMDGGPGEWA